MFCCYLLEVCSFLMRDIKVVVLDRKGGGDELGRVEGGEAAFRLYCMKKEIYI